MRPHFVSATSMPGLWCPCTVHCLGCLMPRSPTCRLNLLQLAPGGHLGRFIVWTQSAFDKLDSIYGTHDKPSTAKKGYKLPRSIMANSDLTRIINSDEIQSIVSTRNARARFECSFP